MKVNCKHQTDVFLLYELVEGAVLVLDRGHVDLRLHRFVVRHKVQPERKVWSACLVYLYFPHHSYVGVV